MNAYNTCISLFYQILNTSINELKRIREDGPEVGLHREFHFGGWIERNNKKVEGQHSGDCQTWTQMGRTREDEIEVAVDLKCCQLFVRLVLLDRYVLQHSARIST